MGALDFINELGLTPDDPPQGQKTNAATATTPAVLIPANADVSDGRQVPSEVQQAASQAALNPPAQQQSIPDWVPNKKLAQEFIDKGVNVDWPTLARASARRMQYQQNHQTMPATSGEQGYYDGYTADDFRNALGGEQGWQKFFGLNNTDFNSPEGRKAIENALVAKFGPGYQGLMADQKFGPFHLDFIMNQLMKDDSPEAPKRPDDPNRPQRENVNIPSLQQYYEQGYNPLLAYFDRKRPISDERIRRAAAAAATSEAMQSLAQLVVGENAPVMKNENKVTGEMVTRLQQILDNERNRDDQDLNMKRNAVLNFLNLAANERLADKARPEERYKNDLAQYNSDRLFGENKYQFDQNDRVKQDQFNRGMDWDKSKFNSELSAKEKMQQRQFAHENNMLQERIKAGIYENRKNGKATLKPGVPVKGKDGKINPAAMTDDLITQVNSYLAAESSSNPDLMVQMKTYEAMLPKGMPPKEKMKAIASMFFDRYMDIDANGQIVPKNGGSTGSWTGWNPDSGNNSSGGESNKEGEDKSLWDEN